MKELKNFKIFLFGFAVLLTTLTGAAQTAQQVRDADKASQYYVDVSAAEQATEKVIARMSADFLEYGPNILSSNLSSYNALVPTTADDPYWGNFEFFGTNAVGRTSVTQVSNGEYGIVSYAQPAGSDGNFAGGVSKLVTFGASGPSPSIFNYAIFYAGLLEFTSVSTMTVNGPVYSSSNIYYGSSANLTFNGPVYCAGLFTNPPWAGQVSYSGKTTTNAGVTTGYLNLLPTYGFMGSPANNIQMLYPPPNGENPQSIQGQMRYYNKAQMVIQIGDEDTTGTNCYVDFVLKSPNWTDPNPVTMHFTNYYIYATNLVGTNRTITAVNSFWTNSNESSIYSNFLTFTNWFNVTNALFYDKREKKWMKVCELDISNFNKWFSNGSYSVTGTSTNFIYARTNGGSGAGKFSAQTPLNIIYIQDLRATNSTTNVVVRLKNGGTSSFPRYGLTVATPNPLYVWGNYNTPNSVNIGSNNVVGTYPASFVSDALTILSSNWKDTNSAQPLGPNRQATSTTVNAAMIAGAVYSTGNTSTNFSGGVHNLPRLMEDWVAGNATLTLNTSLVNLFPSASATGVFVWASEPGDVYNPPVRQFSFNTNYLTAAGLPPGAPLQVNAIGVSQVAQRQTETIFSPQFPSP